MEGLVCKPHLSFAFLVFIMCLYISLYVFMNTNNGNNIRLVNITHEPEKTSPIRYATTYRRDEVDKTCIKQIHIWSDRSTESRSGRKGEFQCHDLTCGLRIVMGKNYHLLQSSDAVVFYQSTPWDWYKMYDHRPVGQKWIFYNWEAPRNTPSRVIPPPKFYNTTYDYIMTFRTGADRALYGSYGKYDNSTPDDKGSLTKNWAANKTGTVIWVASHCNHTAGITWKRSKFVFGLARHIAVDTFGSCGRKRCPPGVEDCSIANYKFYMAVENSECRDYITEKLWYNSYALGVVPIVYGPPKEDYQKVAPPNSFIHVQDFKSIQELAAYLKILDNDDTLYSTYFHWKAKGSTQYNKEFSHLEPEMMCDNIVRRMLADEKDVKEDTFKKPVMPDWKTWWTDSCHHVADFPILMN